MIIWTLKIMQTIKIIPILHKTSVCILSWKKKSKNYRKPHIEQKNNHNLHYNKGKFSAFFKKPAAVRDVKASHY